jgi:hypothetical protein
VTVERWFHVANGRKNTRDLGHALPIGQRFKSFHTFDFYKNPFRYLWPPHIIARWSSGQVFCTSLCRLYEDVLRFVSNSYAVERISAAAKRITGQTSMCAIPVSTDAANDTTKFHGFWQRLAHALDELVAYRAKRAVPEIALRRSKHEVDRYRRLMLKSSMVPVYARAARGSPGHATQTAR